MVTPTFPLITTGQFVHCEGFGGAHNTAGAKTMIIWTVGATQFQLPIPAGGPGEWKWYFQVTVFRHSDQPNWFGVNYMSKLWNDVDALLRSEIFKYEFVDLVVHGYLQFACYGVAPTNPDIWQNAMTVTKFGA